MRFNVRGILVAMAMILGMSSGAQAGTLIAGPLEPDGTSNVLRCNVVNVSTKQVNVTAEIFDSSGAIRNVSAFSIPPGEGRILNANDALLLGFGWCRFTVSGSRANVRATASIFEPGRGTIAAVPAN